MLATGRSVSSVATADRQSARQGGKSAESARKGRGQVGMRGGRRRRQKATGWRAESRSGGSDAGQHGSRRRGGGRAVHRVLIVIFRVFAAVVLAVPASARADGVVRVMALLVVRRRGRRRQAVVARIGQTQQTVLRCVVERRRSLGRTHAGRRRLALVAATASVPVARPVARRLGLSATAESLNVGLKLGLQIGMKATQSGHTGQTGKVGQIGEAGQAQLRLHQRLHVSGRFGLAQQCLMNLHFLVHIAAVLRCAKKKKKKFRWEFYFSRENDVRKENKHRLSFLQGER